MRSVPVLVVLALLAPLVRPAGAAEVDPKLLRALATGVPAPSPRRLLVRAPRRLPVLIELAVPADGRILARLARTGARLHAPGGHPLARGHLVPARLDRGALAALGRLPEVRRVTLLPPRGPLPLDLSAALVGLDGARGAGPGQDLLTGQGVVVADLDTNADVFHPQFFRADAGYFDWLDVDGDGRFTPGVDAIDLDGDGAAGPGETAQLLRAATFYTFTGQPAAARGDTFDPGLDWLFLDQNGNGTRDYGAAAGFDDTTPALGEPLFVPDDLDRSGTLDPGERVVRLGTSKFRKLWVNVGYGIDVDHVYERGVDLSTHQVNFTDGLYGYSDALHGTGVLSIIAGDVPLAGRRWVGMAPDAELLLGWETDIPVSGTLWALDEGANVVLYELSPWTGLPLDGSDPLSGIIDDSTVTDGVTHTCPVGNQAGERKHAAGTVGAGAPLSLPFTLPGALGATYVEVSLNVRGAGATGITVTVTEPGGQSHLLGTSPGTLATGATYYPTAETTSRGTRFVDLVLYTNHPGSAPLPTGAWSLTVTASADAVVDAYVSDEVSGFAAGAAWDESIATDRSTIATPSTADHCIAVGAHTGHPYSPAEPWFSAYPPGGVGEIRDFSAWGPRLDGVAKPDLAAPDNPFVAAPHDQTWGFGTTVLPHGAAWPFGGTSGATPHVTGVAALLYQTGISGDAARDALRASAAHDAVTGTVPNDRYGWGRLDAAAALGASATGAPPTLTLTVSPAAPRPGESVTLTPIAADPDGDAADLELRWDDGYDGSWDSDYAAVAPRTVTAATATTLRYRARLRDATGRFAEALALVTFSDTPAPPDGGSDGGDGGGDGGCGCRAAGSAPGAGVAPLLVLLVAAGARRRRLSARPSGGRRGW
jgi:MYXO-CTERM domain-containing protein